MGSELSRQERHAPISTADLEVAVDRGIGTFIEVGEALESICERREYVAVHGTFEKYLAARWNFTRAHAYRLIGAAKVAAVSPMGDTMTERQARELAPVLRQEGPEKVREVLAKATTAATRRGGKVTARDIVQARDVEPVSAPVAPVVIEPQPCRGCQDAARRIAAFSHQLADRDLQLADLQQRIQVLLSALAQGERPAMSIAVEEETARCDRCGEAFPASTVTVKRDPRTRRTQSRCVGCLSEERAAAAWA